MRYYIIAGEASGDLHGSNLMKGLYTEDPQAEIRFWGGDLMNMVYMQNSGRADGSNRNDGRRTEGKTDRDSSGTDGLRAGGGLVRHYKEGAIMGFWEVFTLSDTIRRGR